MKNISSKRLFVVIFFAVLAVTTGCHRYCHTGVVEKIDQTSDCKILYFDDGSVVYAKLRGNVIFVGKEAEYTVQKVNCENYGELVSSKLTGQDENQVEELIKIKLDD